MVIGAGGGWDVGGSGGFGGRAGGEVGLRGSD